MMLSRRALLTTGLGLGQLALLSKFGVNTAVAGPADGLPTKYLGIHIKGGLHWELLFAPFSEPGMTKHIPGPEGGNTPGGYTPSMVRTYENGDPDLGTGPIRPIQGPIYWDWDNPTTNAYQNINPASGGTQQFHTAMYAFANPTYALYKRMAILVGADQGSPSHMSGIIGAMCGIAGATYRAPAIAAVVANAMFSRFKDDRPLTNVAVGGYYPALAPGLPAVAAPLTLSSSAGAVLSLSERNDLAWDGLRERKDIPNPGFDGSLSGATTPATEIDESLFGAIRSQRGISNGGTDALFEALYDQYGLVSKTLAKDIVSKLEQTPDFEYTNEDPYVKSFASNLGGVAQSAGAFPDAYGPGARFALTLLKSDLATSVTVRMTGANQSDLDTHGPQNKLFHLYHARSALEAVGRLVMEMSVTPSKTMPGKTLLDETVVYVYSDFGRTFPLVGGLTTPSDHHPTTCALLLGGRVIGNRMIGGYDESGKGSLLGTGVPLVEESGEKVTRPQRSQDVAATVLAGFGFQPGKDFFIPGGYGIVDGVHDLG